MSNFAGLPKKFSQYQNAKIVISSIPFDKATSWLSGARFGPKAIIEASEQVELYNIDTHSEVYKKGIFTAPAIRANTSKKMVDQAYRKTLSYLKDHKFVVTLGGDHSISVGPIRAHAEYFKDISILHLDAHSDRRDSYDGNKLSHACVIARAQEVVDNIVSVGIRSMDVSETKKMDWEKIFLAKDIVGTGRDLSLQLHKSNWINNVLKQLSKKVYITLDVDVFDGSIMPSTGTPQPGGLNWYHVMNLLKKVCQKKQVVGLDVVELLPNKLNKAPDFLAAKLIYQFLNHRFLF